MSDRRLRNRRTADVTNTGRPTSGRERRNRRSLESSAEDVGVAAEALAIDLGGGHTPPQPGDFLGDSSLSSLSAMLGHSSSGFLRPSGNVMSSSMNMGGSAEKRRRTDGADMSTNFFPSRSLGGLAGSNLLSEASGLMGLATSGDPIIPPLIITNQSSYSKENVTLQGVTRIIHTVVKETAFEINVAVDKYGAMTEAGSRPILDLTQVGLRAQLVYENAENKVVEAGSKSALEYDVRVNESGAQATITCRARVNSYNLDGSLFKVKVFAVDPQSSSIISPLMSALSLPIKVVAKPEKKKRKNDEITKKRTLNDILIETLSRIELAQQTHQEKLSQLSNLLQATQSGGDTGHNPFAARREGEGGLGAFLLEDDGDDGNKSNREALHSSTSSATSKGNPPPFVSNPDSNQQPERPLSFEEAFKGLMDAFGMMDAATQVERMRHFVEQKGSTAEQLSELHDLFAAEGMERQLGEEVDQIGGTQGGTEGLACECNDCPHRAELQRIEEFYKEVFNL